MGSLNFSPAESPLKDKSPQAPDNEFADKLRASWAISILIGTGLFALITAILIAWPALAFLAARFFQ
jgi:hypothetical protein